LNTSLSIVLLIKIKVLLLKDISYYLYDQLEYDLCVIAMVLVGVNDQTNLNMSGFFIL
tara:strand:+ start:289 stop:462 length:174 start_codon:yes stop_codon:yes gene_type:complete